MSTRVKRRNYSVDVETTGTAYLDDFADKDIVAYCVEHGLSIGLPEEVRDATSEIERLYYATRGDGPLAASVADQVRALLRSLVGRVS